MNGADGRTRVTERDKKSTGSFQNCQIKALSSFYGVSVYQYTNAITILMITRSEYVPLPASRSRFTVFQRRSERQHLQLAITSRRARAAFAIIQPRRGPHSLPPSASNGARASPPGDQRAQGRALVSHARARLSLYQVHM